MANKEERELLSQPFQSEIESVYHLVSHIDSKQGRQRVTNSVSPPLCSHINSKQGMQADISQPFSQALSQPTTKSVTYTANKAARESLTQSTIQSGTESVHH